MSQERPHFSFRVSTLDEDAFHVVRFTGTEGLSKLYQFDLTLISEKTEIDLNTALSGTATLTIKRDQGENLVWHGILRGFRQQQKVDNHVFYRAVLVPKAWQLTQTVHNRIFLNQDLTQNLRDCLIDGGLSQGLDFAVNATDNYPKREYVCQYNESHFDFVSRWMERNGFYFFFDQSGPQEKMELTDSLSIHAPHPQGETLFYEEPSGLDGNITGKAVKNFHCEQRRLPREVLLKDYNYRTPNQEIEGTAQVSQAGEGKVYLHGGHLRSHRQALQLAKIRAEALGCRERIFFGESNAPFIQPGYVAPLEKHYREDFNQKYLIIEVKHEGSQESWLTAGMGATGEAGKLYYRNAFAAIPADVQFRSEVKSVKPVIHGVLKGVIDAEGSGKYAELDDQGRYKVIMPFDLSGRKDGHASAWLRLMQPYTGQGHGMHFPLHKGTEVVLTHYEGDPDRPMIAGALPNLQTPSVINSDNQTMANITTSGGNRIHMEDKEGSERILLHSTPDGDFIRLGAPNDPPSPGDAASSAQQSQANAAAAHAIGSTVKDMANKGITLSTPQWFTVKAAIANTLILGESSSTVVGIGLSNYIGGLQKTTVGLSTEFKCAAHTEFAPIWTEMRSSVTEAALKKTEAAEALTKTVGEHTSLIQSQTKVVNTLTRVTDNHTMYINVLEKNVSLIRRDVGVMNDTIGELDETVGQNTKTIGELDQTVGQHTKTIGELEETSGQHTKTVGDLTETVGEHTKTLGNLTETVGEHTKLAASFTII